MAYRVRGRGSLFIITGPSGAGKTTLIRQLMERMDGLRFSVSCTTRNHRKDEVDGVDYRFVSREQFEQMIEAEEFFEYAWVFGDYYGTPKREVEQGLAAGVDLILNIDVQGARQLMGQSLPAVFVFIAPPSLEDLRRRIEARETESPEQIENRLKITTEEMEAIPEFDYLIVNDRVETAVAFLQAIVHAERCRIVPSSPPAS
ncbi:MAG: guanylate kinase [Candidatus Bipolaricaulia bacterium]